MDFDSFEELDVAWVREEWPQGFRWSCCNEDGESSVGCTKRKHKAHPGWHKKSKGGDGNVITVHDSDETEAEDGKSK